MNHGQRYVAAILFIIFACCLACGWMVYSLYLQRQTGCVIIGLRCVIQTEDWDP